LWIAENYTWAGADSGNFDSKLQDRVTILEDADGDGKSDKRKVFFDQAKRLTSVQIGMGGVWLLCPPQLLFIPDKNHDDVPDGPLEVVLDGFDLGSSSHTVANGLKWGPDGWLYGRQGILGTSKIGVPGSDDAHRITMNTGVWRYHPTRRTAEVVMHGMTNPWGFDYDALVSASSRTR
jgi:putative membrane-bound dehydrogenase-like protein